MDFVRIDHVCSHVPVPRNDSKLIILSKEKDSSDRGTGKTYIKPGRVEVLGLGERVQKLLLLFYAFNNCLRLHVSPISCSGMIIR